MHGAIPARRLRSLRAAAEAILASEAGPPPAERLAWLMDDVTDFLLRAGWRLRLVVFSSLLVCSLAAPLVVRRLPPLRRLPVPTRVLALSRLGRGRLGMPVFAVKALLCLVYYEHPEAALEAGYDGECLE